MGITERLPAGRALVLAPHTDDAELGCGGTIRRLIGNGWDVEVVMLVKAPGAREAETDKSMDILGVLEWSIEDYEDTRLPLSARDLLDRFVRWNDVDLVFCPSRDDVNQDHQTICQEAIRGFKHCSILGYEFPWNHVGTSRRDYAIELSEDQLFAKEKAIAQYHSQAHRPFMRNGVARALAISRGVEFGFEYAEAFECIRWRERL
jgi:N-acetylglucosamine malate deacetylase 1